MNKQLLYHIMICEHTKEYVDDIERILTEIGKRVGIHTKFYSHLELDKDIKQLTDISPVIDLVIINVGFCGQGIGMAQMIAKNKPLLPIIFLEDEEMPLEQAERMLAIGILKKPLNQARLGLLFYRALGQIDLLNEYYGKPNLAFIINKEKILIPCAAISSLEKIQKKIVIRYQGEVLAVRATLKEIALCLPRNFLRINQGVIINVNDIQWGTIFYWQNVSKTGDGLFSRDV